MELPTGVDGYEITGVLGAGGMGTVYAARDQRLARPVALKIVHAELSASPEYRARFEREARALAACAHLHVIAVHACSPADGPRLWLVTELVDGKSLADLAAAGPLPWRVALAIVDRALAGLAAAHARGIMHRDLKPSNILVSTGGVPKLADFGLARGVHQTSITAGDMQLGTLRYLAPEALDGPAIGPEQDVYQMGLVLYELIAGRPAHDAETLAQLMLVKARGWVEPLQTACPEIGPELAALVSTALERRPEARHRDAAAMQRASAAVLEAAGVHDPVAVIAAWLAEPGRARVASPSPPPPGLATQPTERLPRRAAVAPRSRTAFAAALAAVVLAGLSFAVRAPRETVASGADAGMVAVPGGSFLMGRDGGGDDEAPPHPVTVRAIRMDRTEVTNAQFARFVQATGYRTSAEVQGFGYVLFPGKEHDREVAGADWRHPRGPASSIERAMDNPVVQVSWKDAMRYAGWAGKRLPTEAEWEFAARGGAVDCRPAWADHPEKRAHLMSVEVGPVARYEANGYGLYDMAGNAWEFCSDWYSRDYYAVSPAVDPRGPENGEAHVLRSGLAEFGELPDPFDPCTRRGMGDTGWMASDVGFRCVK